MNLREKISIVIVNHNGADTLRPCIESILQSSVSGCPLFVIDNGSDDESVSMLETSHLPFTLIRQDNVGYAEGANIGIRSTHTPFVLIANPDIVFTSSFFEKLLHVMDSHPDTGAAGGKLLRWDKRNGISTRIIDSCGIVRSGCDFIDRGSGTTDRGQYNRQESVFALCGAAILLRREALQNIAQTERGVEKVSYFEPSFFAYKEDIDLCWRMRKKGWRCLYEPSAVAWHIRSLQRGKGMLQRLREKRRQPVFLRELSYRNHLRLLRRNEPHPTWKQRFERGFYIFRFAIFSLLFSPNSLRLVFRKTEILS